MKKMTGAMTIGLVIVLCAGATGFVESARATASPVAAIANGSDASPAGVESCAAAVVGMGKVSSSPAHECRRAT